VYITDSALRFFCRSGVTNLRRNGLLRAAPTKLSLEALQASSRWPKRARAHAHRTSTGLARLAGSAPASDRGRSRPSYVGGERWAPNASNRITLTAERWCMCGNRAAAPGNDRAHLRTRPGGPARRRDRTNPHNGRTSLTVERDKVLPTTVQGIRLKHSIKCQRRQTRWPAVSGNLTVAQLADRLGIPTKWIYLQLRRESIVTTREPSGRFLFPDNRGTLGSDPSIAKPSR
jgi:hypothetical protein